MDTSSKPRTNQWQEIIKRYEQSEQTQSQFCRDNDLKLSQFSYYLEKFRTQLPVHYHQMPIDSSILFNSV